MKQKAKVPHKYLLILTMRIVEQTKGALLHNNSQDEVS